MKPGPHHRAAHRPPAVADLAEAAVWLLRSPAVRAVNRWRLRVEVKRAWTLIWALAGGGAGELRLAPEDLADDLGIDGRSARRALAALDAAGLLRIEQREDTGLWWLWVLDPIALTTRDRLRRLEPDPQQELPLAGADDGPEASVGATSDEAATLGLAQPAADPEVAALERLVAGRRLELARELGHDAPTGGERRKETPPRRGALRATAAVRGTEPPQEPPRSSYDLQRYLYLRPTRPVDLRSTGAGLPEDQDRGGFEARTAASESPPAGGLDFDHQRLQAGLAEQRQRKIAATVRWIDSVLRDPGLAQGVKLKWGQAVAYRRISETELERILRRVAALRQQGQLREAPRRWFIAASKRRWGELKLEWDYVEPAPAGLRGDR